MNHDVRLGSDKTRPQTRSRPEEFRLSHDHEGDYTQEEEGKGLFNDYSNWNVTDHGRPFPNFFDFVSNTAQVII